MKTSTRGICCILSEEAIILSTYDDGGGKLTIGAGHTAAAGPPNPVSGMKISLDEAVKLFRKDLAKYEDDVQAAVSVTLTQNQFDALVSWHFNTGAVGAATTTLTKLLNNGDLDGAAGQFAVWNLDNGQVVDGLVERRKRETAIFTASDYGDRRIPVRQTRSGAAQDVSTQDIIALLDGSANAVAPLPVDDEENASTEELLANPKSSLLPQFRPRQDDGITRATIRKFVDRLPAERQSDRVLLLAIRGYFADSLGKAGENDRGLYDDAIFVIEQGRVYPFNANTDPSRFKAGIAKLKASQAVRYKPGLHGFNRAGGPYPAFRQDSNCTVVRDQKGDDTGMFFINLHRGGNTTTSSAGCQTIPPHQWDEFKALVDRLLAKYGQETFYYLIVDRADVATDVQVATNSSIVVEPKRPVAVNGELVVASVADLQRALNFLGGNAGEEDNKLGPKTKEAIERFEKLCRLPVTGSPTPTLMSAVQAVYVALGGK